MNMNINMNWCELFRIMIDELHNRELRMYSNSLFNKL